jgi:hypothetical protein
MQETCRSCGNYKVCSRFGDVACDAANNYRFYKAFITEDDYNDFTDTDYPY